MIFYGLAQSLLQLADIYLGRQLQQIGYVVYRGALVGRTFHVYASLTLGKRIVGESFKIYGFHSSLSLQQRGEFLDGVVLLQLAVLHCNAKNIVNAHCKFDGSDGCQAVVEEIVGDTEVFVADNLSGNVI